MSDDIFSLKIFDWIDINLVNKIFTYCKRKKNSLWDFIIKQWELSNWEGYIIISGNASVIKDEKEIAILWKWDIFWEIALLNEENRTASVIAKSELELLIINQDDILELISNWNQSINKDIMRRIEENLKNY